MKTFNVYRVKIGRGEYVGTTDGYAYESIVKRASARIWLNRRKAAKEAKLWPTGRVDVQVIKRVHISPQRR